MGKSSSSLKKKRSKNSSKAKASSRSKIRKNKFKKVRRHEVSLSSSDYDDSKSLNTSASSSSEDSYRRKRDLSRKRKDVKGRKKRVHRRSYSIEDSHYSRKKKKAKRKNEYDEVREKAYQKKKIRREASVSSMSSRPWSCSTCQDGSAPSNDSQYESRRGRSERKEKDRRKLRGRSRSEKSSRYKARSSSCSPCSKNSYEGTEEKYVGDNNSRWLRSVITVTKEAEESEELCRNETKEEIVDDHDYPCRSNDSNDGGTKRELDHHTLLASEEKLRVENEVGDMSADPNFTEPNLRDGSYNDSSNLNAYSAGTSEAMKKEPSETSGANLNGDNLESILRQRALENLRKFQGEMQSAAKTSVQKNKIDSQVKHPITDKHELVQGKSIINDVTVGTKFDKQTPIEETNLPGRRRNLIAYPRNNEKILNMDKDISGSSKHHSTRAPEKVIDSDNPSGTVTESTNHSTSNLEFTTQTQKFCHDSLQTSASHELSNAKSSVTKGDGERNVAKTTQAAIQSIKKNDRDVGELHASVTSKSCFEGSSVENKSGKLQDESNQGSQFEQKTMSVMRGGEMVQVSYKVYIPNKVPALARRQLKR